MKRKLTIGLSGTLLTSRNPNRTAKFYLNIAGLKLQKIRHGDTPEHWEGHSQGIHFAIHNAKFFAKYTYPAVTKSNLTHLYFSISDVKQFNERLRKHKLRLFCPPESVAGETVMTVQDPDGRKVMFGTF